MKSVPTFAVPPRALLLVLFFSLPVLPVTADPGLSSIRVENSLVTISFTAEPGVAAEEFAVETSPDLGQTPWEEVSAILLDLGNGRWQAVVAALPSPSFFRIKQGDDPITASFPTASVEVVEGENNSVGVTFSAPFTGTLNYSIQSSGDLFAGQIEVTDSDRASIPIPIEDDEEVNVLEALSVHLEAASDGVAYRIETGGSAQLVVEDNDEFRSGTLSSEDGLVDVSIRLLITRQAGLTSAVLVGGSDGLIQPNPADPDGHWTFSSFALTADTFDATVTVEVPAAEFHYNADTELVITLAAIDAENLASDIWEGAFTLDIKVPTLPHLAATRSGTFLLIKEPPQFAELPPPAPIAP